MRYFTHTKFHHPHFTDEEPRLRNLPKVTQRQTWNTSTGLSDSKGTHLKVLCYFPGIPNTDQSKTMSGPEAPEEIGGYASVTVAL